MSMEFAVAGKVFGKVTTVPFKNKGGLVIFDITTRKDYVSEEDKAERKVYDFFRIEVYSPDPEGYKAYFTEGKLLSIFGTINPKIYKNKEGKDIKTQSYSAKKVEFLGDAIPYKESEDKKSTGKPAGVNAEMDKDIPAGPPSGKNWRKG